MNDAPRWFVIYAAAVRIVAVAGACWVLSGGLADTDIVPAATMTAGAVLAANVNAWAMAGRMLRAPKGGRSAGRMTAPAWMSERGRS